MANGEPGSVTMDFGPQPLFEYTGARRALSLDGSGLTRIR